MSSEVRHPTAWVNDNIIDRASVQARVGTFPEVSFTSHPGVDRGPARPINASEFISALAADQEQAYNGTPSLMMLLMDDAKSSRLPIPSLITSPSYSTGIGYTGRKRNGVYPAAAVIGLRTDIYTGAKDEWRVDNNPGDASVAARLKSLTEFIIKEWEDIGGGDDSELSYETKQTIHAQNEPRLQIWYQILEASVSTTEIEALGSLKDDNPAVNSGVNSWMVALLRSSKQNFMRVIEGFCSAFHLIFEPPSEQYPVGRLVKLADLLQEDPEEMSIMVVQEDLTAGPLKTLPLKKVIITGVSTTEYRDNGDMKDGRSSIGASNIAEYPPGEFAGGSIQSFGMPPYLPSPVRSAPGLDASAGLTAENYNQAVKDLRDGVNGYISDSMIALCEHHAKGLYANLALSNSQASITGELDLRFRAGKRYKVSATNKQGETTIFTGILLGVTHTIHSKQDSPYAASELNFAYVEADGFSFELP